MRSVSRWQKLSEHRDAAHWHFKLKSQENHSTMIVADSPQTLPQRIPQKSPFFPAQLCRRWRTYPRQASGTSLTHKLRNGFFSAANTDLFHFLNSPWTLPRACSPEG